MPGTLETCYESGLDVETWVGEGIMDMLSSRSSRTHIRLKIPVGVGGVKHLKSPVWISQLNPIYHIFQHISLHFSTIVKKHHPSSSAIIPCPFRAFPKWVYPKMYRKPQQLGGFRKTAPSAQLGLGHGADGPPSLRGRAVFHDGASLGAWNFCRKRATWPVKP